MGAWALLPPYSGPALNTEMRVEVADHLVPGIVVLVASLAAPVLTGRARTPQVMLFAGLAVLLAGLWMTATHVPLVAQALRDEAPVAGTLYHVVPSVAVAFLGTMWAGRFWGATTAT